MAARPAIDVPAATTTTVYLAVGAVVAALLAMFGEAGSFTLLTVSCALAGLVPWALVVRRVALESWVFFALSAPFAVLTILGDDNLGGLFPLLLAVVWLTRTAPTWRWPVASLLTAGVVLVVCSFDKGYDEPGTLYFAGGLVISWMCGTLLRRSERLAAELAAVRDAEVERLAALERARIARDVHDVVAHSLTVVMLNLTGARRALAVDPIRVDEALARAEIVGRDSLESIREVMGLLRDPGATDTLPYPSIAQLEPLVRGFRDTGLELDFELDAEAAVDPTVELVAYRIVQESLANVLQHAPGAAAVVTVSVAATVEVVVRNGPPPVAPEVGTRTGLGTRGMAERARAVGGVFRSGPIADGGWEVVASLPNLPTGARPDAALTPTAHG